MTNTHDRWGCEGCSVIRKGGVICFVMLCSNDADCSCVYVDLTTLAGSLNRFRIVFTSIIHAAHGYHAESIVGAKGLWYDGVQSAYSPIVTCGDNKGNVFFLAVLKCMLQYRNLTRMQFLGPASTIVSVV